MLKWCDEDINNQHAKLSATHNKKFGYVKKTKTEKCFCT